MDNAETRCDQVGVSAATPEAATVAVTSPGGDLPDVELAGRTRPTESTFATALDGTTGHPVSTGVMGATSHPPPSPEDSVLASIARIEARFSGLCERQERTEDAMAVLMSARHTSGTQRVPPTPVHFGGIGPGSLFPSGDPAVIHNRRNRRNEGLESDSSEELERSHAERHTRSTASGQREQQPGGFSRYVASTGGDGGGPNPPSQEGSVPSLPEVGPGTIPATLLQALTTQITVRIMKKMESDEFAHQLARRLGDQDAGEDIVNEVFRSVLTPERYRLEDRSPVVTDVMRNTSHRAMRSMQTLMKGVPMFGNPNGRPLAVIGFLSSFKAAADKALVNEGLAVEILPFFVDERVRGILRQTAPMPGVRSSESPTSYEGILKELLSSYLSEDKCEDHYRALRTATAHPWEDEEMFGRRIQELDYELGKLLGEGELRAILFAGVPNYVRISARGANTAKTTFSRLMHLCKSLGDAYRVLHPECALQAKPKGEDDKTVDTRPVSEPRRYRPEPKAPPVLVASGYPEAEHDWDSTRALVDYQGHKLVPAMPVVDDQGTVAYIAPEGTQFQNYKVSATLGVTPQSTKAYFPVLDTGAGPNLLRKDTLPDSWLTHVRDIRGPTIKDANGRIIRTTQAVTLTADIGNLTTEVDFLVCETLSVPCILGCSFINKHVEAIRPSKRVIDLHDADGSARGCTAIVRDLTATPIHVNVAEVYADAVPAVVRLAKRTRFEAMTETVTPVHCDLAGLCQVRSVQRTHHRQGVTLANGLIDLPVGGPAYVVVANYRHQAVILPKGARLGIAEPLEGSIATLPEDRVEPLEVLPITEEKESSAPVSTEADPACNQAGTDGLTEADLRHLPARVAEKP
ncbi:hypothetical protein MMPV_010022 [Pyropia vietnamensis]